MAIGGYVTIKSHSRKGGTVSASKQFHTKAYTRKNGKKVKASKSQFNSAHSRRGTTVKKHKRRLFGNKIDI